MKREDVIVLGIDPGSIVTGYGIVSASKNTLTAVDFGCIRPKGKKLSFRYRYIYEGLLELCEKYRPNAIAIEEQYVHKNVISALKLGGAKAACMIAADKCDIAIFGYNPSKAKKAVVGNGRASKFQIQAMVKHLLKLQAIPEPEDAADALALAICHINNSKFLHQMKEI